LGAERPDPSLVVRGENRVGSVEEAVDPDPDRLDPSQVRGEETLL
jgi:hypothetical protein